MEIIKKLVSIIIKFTFFIIFFNAYLQILSLWLHEFLDCIKPPKCFFLIFQFHYWQNKKMSKLWKLKKNLIKILMATCWIFEKENNLRLNLIFFFPISKNTWPIFIHYFFFWVQKIKRIWLGIQKCFEFWLNSSQEQNRFLKGKETYLQFFNYWAFLISFSFFF